MKVAANLLMVLLCAIAGVAAAAEPTKLSPPDSDGIDGERLEECG
jgi:hypothetical protein